MAILGSKREQDSGPQPQPQGAGTVPEYDAEVNKGSISVSMLPAKLNRRAQQGWRLHSIFEQHGNTIIIYERWR